MTWLSTIVLVAAMLAAAPGSVTSAEEGVRAPNVEMRDARGRRVRLADFTGKVVLVDLWASWCAPCKVTFPALDALYREYRSGGVEMIAVNLDERRKDAEAFLKAYPHEMLVTFDPRAQVLRAFGAPGIPSSYLIDREGVIRFTHLGLTDDAHAKIRDELDALIAEPSRHRPLR
jgi:thiol-disulfide isomerase/thioredoxin